MVPSNEEREMTTHQRSLVNNCFEEGQYESGMAVLDQLRSSSFKPPSDHVRQLLYIALFPPPPAGGDQTAQQEQFPLSPGKGSPTKQQPALSKASLSPSVPESETAQRILFSFLATNSPGSLFRALPRYPIDDATDNDISGQIDSGHDEDSLIARESLCLRNCRNCWVVLKEGFIQRKQLLPHDSRKKRGRGAYDTEHAILRQGSDTPAVVAEHAWPILHWFLSLFEKDQSVESQKSGEMYSPFLLSQIPPPRGGTGPRWDAGAPLDVVFHSIRQEDTERRAMATRLLTLLINLSHSGLFDGTLFATTLTTRLYTSSPLITQNLMEGLPKTVPVLTFKISVCQKFLSSSSSSSSSSSAGTKPRPRPLPRRGSRRDLETISPTGDNDTGRAASSISARPTLATLSEIVQLLSSSQKTTGSVPPVLNIKYTLLVSYALLQGPLPPEERDDDWKIALSNGRLKQLIDEQFPSDSKYHRALTIISTSWSAV